ncbi:phosphatidylinositol-glycan-specific phospholipase D, partial [Elysia marginata]
MMKTVKICSQLVQCLFFTCCYLFGVAISCGAVTHIEISHQALENFKDVSVDYSLIASSHQDALEAGSAYPDAFYPPTCFFGQYHGVSEDTHWTQFLNASISYINKYHPKPWNTDIQRLVAFLLGVVSHQVADVLWHSLGIEQGFIETMAKMDFHDVYQDAHIVADT